MLVCLPTGIAVAYLLARRRFPGKFLLDALVQMPMVLPPVVPGFLLLLLFGTQGPIGGWLKAHFGIVIAFTWQGAALASATMAFPLMVQPVRLALRMIDGRLEQAASTLGARPWRVFLTVTLPLATPGIIAGAVLCFTRSLGEFGATMAFVGNIPGVTRTLPLAIYSYTHVPGGDAPAMRLALLSILLALVALIISHLITRRAERLLGYRSHAES
jgi:molybdate transport system permease protein